MVDLHSHILPGIDDGARDMDEAIAMLRVAANDGIHTIVATPHQGAATAEVISIAVTRLNQEASHVGIPVRIVAGTEARVSLDLARLVQEGTLPTLNGSPYLLVELPLASPWPPFLSQAIYQLQLVGIQPVLAHAERYTDVQRHPAILQDLISRDVIVQVNAGSLTTDPRSARGRAARHLIRTRLAHVIASDAHDPTIRPPRLSEALAAVTNLAGSAYAKWMTETAEAIVQGQPVTLPDPASKPAPSLIQRLLNRDR